MARQWLQQTKSFQFHLFNEIAGDVLNLQMNFDLSLFMIQIQNKVDNFYYFYFYKGITLIKFEKFVSMIDFAFMKTSNSYVLISYNQIEIWVPQDDQWDLKQVLGSYDFPKYYRFGESFIISEQDDQIILFNLSSICFWIQDNRTLHWEFTKQINLNYSSKIQCSLNYSGTYLVICQNEKQHCEKILKNQLFQNHYRKWTNICIPKIQKAFKAQLLGESFLVLQKYPFSSQILFELNLWNKKIIQKRNLGFSSQQNLIFCNQNKQLYVYYSENIYVLGKGGNNYYKIIKKVKFKEKIRYLFLHKNGGSLFCIFDLKAIEFQLE